MEKTVLMFPGQGSQYEKMGLDFLFKNEKYNKHFNMCSKKIREDSIALINNGKKLNQTRYSQPLIYTLSAAIYDYLSDLNNLDVSAAIGHSLGEYSALYCSGAYSFNQGLELVNFRAKIMEEENSNSNGMMAAVLSKDIEKIKEIIKRSNAYIANYNDYSQYVISGHKENVIKAIKDLKANGIRKAIPLKVNIASHCPLMEDVANKLGNYLYENIEIGDTRIPFYSSTRNEFVNKDEIKSALTEQLIMPINWLDTVLFFLNSGYRAFIEIGPKKVLSNLVKRISKKEKKEVKIFNTDTLEDIGLLKKYLEGA